MHSSSSLCHHWEAAFCPLPALPTTRLLHHAFFTLPAFTVCCMPHAHFPSSLRSTWFMGPLHLHFTLLWPGSISGGLHLHCILLPHTTTLHVLPHTLATHCLPFFCTPTTFLPLSGPQFYTPHAPSYTTSHHLLLPPAILTGLPSSTWDSTTLHHRCATCAICPAQRTHHHFSLLPAFYTPFLVWTTTHFPLHYMPAIIHCYTLKDGSACHFLPHLFCGPRHNPPSSRLFLTPHVRTHYHPPSTAMCLPLEGYLVLFYLAVGEHKVFHSPVGPTALPPWNSRLGELTSLPPHGRACSLHIHCSTFCSTDLPHHHRFHYHVGGGYFLGVHFHYNLPLPYICQGYCLTTRATACHTPLLDAPHHMTIAY